MVNQLALRISTFFVLLLCAVSASGQVADDTWSHGKQEMERYLRFKQRLAADQVKKASLAQDDYDAAHYDITLDIDVSSETITGTLAAKVVALNGGITQVTFDLMGNMVVSDVREGGASITYNHASDLLTMVLTGTYNTGDTIRLEIDYAGPPAVPNAELGLSSFTFDTRIGGEVVIYSLSEPYFARSWWPCKDVPDDKATVTMDVTVPDTLVVASNGTLENEVDLGGGRKRFYWVENYLISTYLVSLAVSNYTVYSDYYHHSPTDSMEVRYFVFPEALPSVQAQWDSTVEMLTAFSNRFGEYPFVDEKYGMAQIRGPIAMENQTCSSMGVTAERIAAHELSHQWWGDMVTPVDWKDIWLNEGFATYCEAVWQEHKSGFDAYKLTMSFKKLPCRQFDGTLYDPPTLFDPCDVYNRGAWVLHMLRHVVGDADFFAALRQYRSDFEYGNATTLGFQSACETVYGASLDWFFDQWVFGWSLPEYEYHWRQTGTGAATTVDLTLWQTQSSGIIAMPIDVRVTMPSGDSTVVVWNDAPLETYHLTMPESVIDLQVDPDEWILRELSPRDLTSFPSFNVFPNPFNAGTTVSFELNVSGNIEVAVFDVTGAPIRVLARESRPAGFHVVVWDGKNSSGQLVATGVYFVRLKTPQSWGLRKAVHIK